MTRKRTMRVLCVSIFIVFACAFCEQMTKVENPILHQIFTDEASDLNFVGDSKSLLFNKIVIS